MNGRYVGLALALASLAGTAGGRRRGPAARNSGAGGTAMTGVRTWVVWAGVAVGVCHAADARAQVIVNGSFESGAFVPDANNLMSLPPGSTAMTGWTTFNAELVWARNDNPFISPASDGNFFLDLTGNHDATPYGGVQQTFASIPGAPYHVTFDIGVVRNGFPAFSGPATVQVAATGAAPQDFTYNPTSGLNALWGNFSYDFVAAGPSTTLSLLGIASGGGQYIGLDNVQVTTSPVPEPSGLAFMFVTLAAAALRRRLCRRAGA
jgi:Protein of unknown function (DUF642)